MIFKLVGVVIEEKSFANGLVIYQDKDESKKKYYAILNDSFKIEKFKEFKSDRVVNIEIESSKDYKIGDHGYFYSKAEDKIYKGTFNQIEQKFFEFLLSSEEAIASSEAFWIAHLLDYFSIMVYNYYFNRNYNHPLKSKKTLKDLMYLKEINEKVDSFFYSYISFLVNNDLKERILGKVFFYREYVYFDVFFTHYSNITSIENMFILNKINDSQSNLWTLIEDNVFSKELLNWDKSSRYSDILIKMEALLNIINQSKQEVTSSLDLDFEYALEEY